MQLTIYHCAHCNGFVPEGRSDKRYCSSSCKQKNYRWRAKEKRYASDAKKNISDVAAYLAYPETRDAAIEALSFLSAYCQEIARQYGVKLVRAK